MKFMFSVRILAQEAGNVNRERAGAHVVAGFFFAVKYEPSAMAAFLLEVINLLTIKNRADVAEIYLSGDIVDDEEGGLIESFLGNSTGYEFPQKLRTQLDAIGSDKPIDIHINSCGGSIFAGVAMANFIANHRGKTTSIVDGIAGSIASQIFFSADVCKIPTNAYLMLHKPFAQVQGNGEELRKAAESLDTIQAGLETTYQKKALEGVTAEEIHAMLEVETWLTGTEAATKFQVKVLDPLKALNCVGVDRLKSRQIPAALNQAALRDEDRIKIILARARGLMI